MSSDKTTIKVGEAVFLPSGKQIRLTDSDVIELPGGLRFDIAAGQFVFDCEVCSKEFHAVNYQQARFCSASCRVRANNGAKTHGFINSRGQRVKPDGTLAKQRVVNDDLDKRDRFQLGSSRIMHIRVIER